MQRILFVCVVLLLWILVSYLTNWESQETPETAYPKDIPIPIQITLERSCYDCHTNYTRIPWYGKVFPVNLYLKSHVSEGKESLNLSEWDGLSIRKKAALSLDILEQVEEGSMPPFSYTLIHWDSILQDEEVESLRYWQEVLEKLYEEHETFKK